MPLGLRLVRRGQLAQCFAHARRALGLCAKPSPGKVSRSLHAAYARTGPRDALPDVTDSASATATPGLRSNCAKCAQQIRSSVRTVGTHSGAYWQ